MDDIKNNKEQYNVLVATINKCDFSRFSYGQFISKEYFPDILNKELASTKLNGTVEYIIFFKNPDSTQHYVELVNNSAQNGFNLVSGNYYIIYDPIYDFPLPNSYSQVGLIETWGIDSNWSIQKDNEH